MENDIRKFIVGDRQTYRQHGDIISLLLLSYFPYFEYSTSRLMR
jgi:hypothetical protein